MGSSKSTEISVCICFLTARVLDAQVDWTKVSGCVELLICEEMESSAAM